MTNNPCIKQITDKEISFEENKSKFILLNPAQLKIEKIQVDG